MNYIDLRDYREFLPLIMQDAINGVQTKLTDNGRTKVCIGASRERYLPDPDPDPLVELGL